MTASHISETVATSDDDDFERHFLHRSNLLPLSIYLSSKTSEQFSASSVQPFSNSLKRFWDNTSLRIQPTTIRLHFVRFIVLSAKWRRKYRQTGQFWGASQGESANFSEVRGFFHSSVDGKLTQGREILSDRIIGITEQEKWLTAESFDDQELHFESPTWFCGHVDLSIQALESPNINCKQEGLIATLDTNSRNLQLSGLHTTIHNIHSNSHLASLYSHKSLSKDTRRSFQPRPFTLVILARMCPNSLWTIFGDLFSKVRFEIRSCGVSRIPSVPPQLIGGLGFCWPQATRNFSFGTILTMMGKINFTAISRSISSYEALLKTYLIGLPRRYINGLK